MPAGESHPPPGNDPRGRLGEAAARRDTAAARRWGLWGCVAVAAIGAVLAAGGYAAQQHAMRGTVVAADTPHELDGSSPVHVVGVISPGDDVTQPATCTVSGPEGTATIAVTTRKDRWGSTTAGRRLPGHPTRLICDRRVAITFGPAVWTYPAADWWLLHCYVLLAAGAAVKAIGHARDRRRPPLAVVATAARPGVEEARA